MKWLRKDLGKKIASARNEAELRRLMDDARDAKNTKALTWKEYEELLWIERRLRQIWKEMDEEERG